MKEKTPGGEGEDEGSGCGGQVGSSQVPSASWNLAKVNVATCGGA